MKHLALFFLFLILQVSCKTKEKNSSSQSNPTSTVIQNNNGLIKDCPEELIWNVMPTVGKAKSNIKDQYYIYKGLRKEITEFDSVWVSKNCKVKTIVAQ